MSLTEVITKEIVVKELNQVLDGLNKHPGLQVSSQKRKHMNSLMSSGHIEADEAFARVMYAEMFGRNRKAISTALSRFQQQTGGDNLRDRLREKLNKRQPKA